MCDDAGQLMSVDEVVSCMRAEKFKPNCGLGTSCFSPQAVWPLIYMLTSSPRFFGPPWLLNFGEGALVPRDEPAPTWGL